MRTTPVMMRTITPKIPAVRAPLGAGERRSLAPVGEQKQGLTQEPISESLAKFPVVYAADDRVDLAGRRARCRVVSRRPEDVDEFADVDPALGISAVPAHVDPEPTRIEGREEVPDRGGRRFLLSYTNHALVLKAQGRADRLNQNASGIRRETGLASRPNRSSSTSDRRPRLGAVPRSSTRR